MTSRNRQSSSVVHHSKNQRVSTTTPETKKKPVIRHRKIELSAIVEAAVNNDSEDEEPDADGVEEEDEEEDVIKPTFNASDNRNKQTRRESSLVSQSSRGRRAQPVSSYDDDYLAPGESYAYLWNDPTIRRILKYMALFAVIMLWLNVVVAIMWFAGRIPGLPSSLLYYGFIFYALFIGVAILVLFTSCSTENIMYTVTLILLFIGIVLAILMDYMIYLSISDCYAGVLDTTCNTFYFTSILLFLLTLAISVTLLILLFLTSIMVVRIKQAYSTVNAFY